ncbi:MAG: thiol reductant ABC exporter subunit CydC [Anaerolineae bacterium]|nr:thiol reductant ABC exporter subunit CydC [Anaerolineae bacterium]
MKHPLWHLIRLLLPFRRWIALSIALGALTVLSSVGLMATSAYIIAAAALHPSIADLQVAIVGVRFFGLARGVFRYLERYLSHEVTFRLLGQLRVWFYAALEPLAPARLWAYHSGDLLTRAVGDIEALQHFYIRAIAPPLVAALIAVTTSALLGSFNALLGTALLGLFAIGGFGLAWLSWHFSRTSGREVIRRRAQATTLITDGIQGMADLLAFGQEHSYANQLGDAHRAWARSQCRLGWLNAVQDGLGIALMHGGAMMILALAIPLAYHGEIAGVYLAVITLGALASFEAALALPQAAHHLASSLEAARRLFEITDAEPPIREPERAIPPPASPIVRIRDLWLRYGSDEPWALRGVNLDLLPGHSIAVVGPSGSGKSSLARALLRLWEYERGSITIGGVELRQIASSDVPRIFAYVAQQTHLFNGTIRENLLLACPNAAEEDIIRAAEAAQAHAFIASLPRGYDTWVGELGLRLSGGERQRIAIARALLQDAPVLILDEPTANLDAITERRLLEVIRQIARDRSLLLITHRLTGIAWADEILVLKRGQIVERGSHEELLRHRGEYWRMLTLQQSAIPDMTPSG